MPPRASILRGRTDGAGSRDPRLRIRAVTAGRSPRGWRCASGEVVGRNPQIRGSTLISVDDNCIPDCAQGKNGTEVWTYRLPSGTFTAPTSPA